MTTAECKKPYYYDTTERNSDGGRRQSLAYLEDEYVVIINTQHPQIASQLEEAFTRAEKYLRDGNNFRVTVGTILLADGCLVIWLLLFKQRSSAI